MTKLKTGDKAPSFKLLDQDGKATSIGDFKGKKLLVYFYPKANTPGCTKQSCSVSAAVPDLKKLNIAAVGISPDSPDKQKKFDEKYGLGFPLLADEDRSAASAFGVVGEKTMFGKKVVGIIRSSFLIDETGRIVDAWYKVKPEDTVPIALEALGNRT